MTRSGYTDDCEYLELWRGAVDRAMRGKRGQSFLKELATAMDAMPEKVLIANELENDDGNVCAIGAVCKARGLDTEQIDYNARERVAKVMGIAESMAAEIAYMNDEWSPGETPEHRWARMRAWVQQHIQAFTEPKGKK